MSRMPQSYFDELTGLIEMISFQTESEAFKFTDSPIEGIFATAFQMMGELLFGRVALHEPGFTREWSPAERHKWILQCQVPIGQYRVDFVASGNPVRETCRVIVECDGHAFHERTKEQAARDKARDRFLQAQGYKVFRFTGSELYRAPMLCAQEVLEELERQLFAEPDA